MPERLLIRDYDPGDWEAIADVHDRARMDELWLTVGLSAFRTLAETAHDEGLFDGTLRVAEADGRIAGFIVVEGDAVSWLYTDPDRYRQGIGRCLLRDAIDRATGDLTVSVLAGNDPALALYRSEGFEIVETRQGNLLGFDDFPACGHELRRCAA